MTFSQIKFDIFILYFIITNIATFSGVNIIKRLRIGITGATGGLGSRLVEYLSGSGMSLRCLVRKAGTADRLEEAGSEIVYGDILDPPSLEAFVRDLDVVIHLAAQVGHATEKTFRLVNGTGTGNLCRAIRDHAGNCRLVYCSSIATLRIPRLFPFLATAYARSKRYGEKIVESSGIDWTIVHSGLIYGPGDRNFLPQIIKNLKKNRIILVGGGEHHAPLVYLDDLCDLLGKLAATPGTGNRHYLGVKPLEIGIHDFFMMVADATGCPRPKHRVPKSLLLPVALVMETLYGLLGLKKMPAVSRRTVDVLSISLDPAVARADTLESWTASTDIESGLKKALQWYGEQRG